MNKSTIFFAFCLLVIVKLFSVVNCKMDEEGARYFNEKISVKDNTTLFIVQKYNEVLNDFNLGLTITRVPDVGICHIKPLEKNLPNPGKLKAYMDFLKRLNASLDGKSGLLGASASEWTIDKRLETKDLKPHVVKFCGRLPVYSMKEITKDKNDDFQTYVQELFTKSFERIDSRRKRSIHFPLLCPEAYSGNMLHNCGLDSIISCKFMPSARKVCYEDCAVSFLNRLSDDLTMHDCNFSYNFWTAKCCMPKCPNK